MSFNIGSADYNILLLLITLTVVVGLISLKLIKESIFRVVAIFMLFSVFMYSGYGISYSKIDNSYIAKYVVYIIALVIPLIIVGRKKKNVILQKESNIDKCLINHYATLKRLTVLYFVMLFIPLVYPEFRLFDLFIYGGGITDSFYDDRNMYKANQLITLVDMLVIFLRPFFFAYLVIYKQKKTGNYWPTILFALTILMAFMRYRYFGRYQMLVYGTELYILTFGIKGFRLHLPKKHILAIVGILIAFIPLLYAYTYTRIGAVVENLSLGKSLELLIESEVYYPMWYDHILNSGFIKGQSAALFILWLICLPIPSFIWPSKPKISADEFTYSITGKRYTDAGYSSFLPSAMGEGFMFFGEDFYWIHALIIGLVTALVLRYLIKHKTMAFYVAVTLITTLIIGRGGAGSFIPPLVNGVMPIIIMSYYLRPLVSR